VNGRNRLEEACWRFQLSGGLRVTPEGYAGLMERYFRRARVELSWPESETAEEFYEAAVR